MALPGRKESVVFRRNDSKDEQIGGIEYTGYDVFWPSGRRVRGLAFDRFCKIGVRYLLGREKPEIAAVDVYFLPLPHRDVLLPRVPGCRLRVLYLERTGSQLKLFLSDDTPTDIVFDLERDEERVLTWLGARQAADGGRQWFGFYAVRKELAEIRFPLRPGAGRGRTWPAPHAVPIHQRAPRLDGDSEGMFLSP
ncbi:MAG TPA: hypothetical protein VMS17_11820 [Gemmataceae bacterium]|nr:hypothetical protein [Gemmataceae bacterium]